MMPVKTLAPTICCSFSEIVLVPAKSAIRPVNNCRAHRHRRHDGARSGAPAANLLEGEMATYLPRDEVLGLASKIPSSVKVWEQSVAEIARLPE